jgi:hypothetical protein
MPPSRGSARRRGLKCWNLPRNPLALIELPTILEGKRHILVDSQGHVLRAKVHTADIQDRAGVPLLLAGAADDFPRIKPCGLTRATPVVAELDLGAPRVAG